jgi:hypothetical protein
MVFFILPKAMTGRKKLVLDRGHLSSVIHLHNSEDIFQFKEGLQECCMALNFY